MNVKGKTLLEKIGSLMPKPKTRPVNQKENMKEWDSQFKKAVFKKQQSKLNPQADAASKARNEAYGKAMDSAYKATNVFGKIK